MFTDAIALKTLVVKKSGGGVLIGVNRKYDSELILSAESNGCEQLWIKIINNKHKLILGILYIPPNSSSQ